MLELYKEKYAKSSIQYLVLDFNGDIKDTDNILFSNIIGVNISEIHPFFESFLSLIELSSNEEYLFSCIHLNYNGKAITADITLKTFDDKTYPFVGIHDLTSHYENYQTTAQVRNESVINSQVLELKNSYLKEKEDFKNAFITNFSHELRDPITGVLTFTDILSQSGLNVTQKDYVNIIKSSSNHLRKLIDDILDISKIEVGKLALNIEAFDIIDLLENLEATYKIKAERNGLQFHLNYDSKLPKIVEGDSVRLRQMLTNLLDNAIKFTTEGTVSLNVSLNQIRAQKASVHFEVVDTGIGIKEEHFDVIFESFTQISENTNTNSGSGLGLSISKHLVELTNSKIKVESELGKGSTFSTNLNFRLLNSSDKEKRKLKNEEDEEISNQKYNILLVDNSEIVQLSTLKILASKGKYFLDIATNVEDVLNRVRIQDFDLILIDIKFNDQEETSLTKQIRELPDRKYKKLPILAIAARTTKEDLKIYKKQGITDVIKKPFDEKSLIDKINEVLKIK